MLNLARPDVRDYVLGLSGQAAERERYCIFEVGLQPQLERAGMGSGCRRRSRSGFTWSSRGICMGFWRSCGSGIRRWRLKSCSGGGGRVDLGILRYVDEVWPSDNTDPFDRLTQQDGFTYAYTPQIMMAWVTDSPHWLNKRTTSLQYRMLSSMQGSLGIGANIAKWTPDEMATAKRLIAAYHQVQPTIVQGDLVPADFAAEWQRVLGDANGEAQTRASRWCSRSSTRRRRGACFRL